MDASLQHVERNIARVRRAMTLAALLSLMLLGRVAGAQDSIVLRTTARPPASGPLTLGDVATLAGNEATRLAGVVILDEAALRRPGPQSCKVDVRSVREALDRSDIRWGKVTLSGGTCEITGAASPAPKAKPTPPARTGVQVRDCIARRLAELAQAPVEDLRLSFEESRRELLDLPAAGRSVVVAPTGVSERMPVNVRVLEGGKLIAEGSTRVGVQVRRQVLVLRSAVARGDKIDESEVDAQERWLPPTLTPATKDQALGSAARARISAGEIVLARDVESPAAVRKGQLVAVDCVVGGIVVRMNNARALMDGREGEEILVSPSAATAASAKAAGDRGPVGSFRAKVSAPGRVVALTQG